MGCAGVGGGGADFLAPAAGILAGLFAKSRVFDTGFGGFVGFKGCGDWETARSPIPRRPTCTSVITADPHMWEPRNTSLRVRISLDKRASRPEMGICLSKTAITTGWEGGPPLVCYVNAVRPDT
jgi:hypothetical protein